MSWRTWWCCFLSTTIVTVSLCSVLATNTSCPTWNYYNNDTGQCECGSGLVCSSDGHQVEIENGFCATSSEKEGKYYIGECPFTHTINSTNRVYSEMPSNAGQLDEVMCGPYNRRGLLCGECKDGHGPPAYSLSLKCTDCSSLKSGYAISLYLLLQFVPITFIFICFIVFRFNITSGPLLGYVLFCQIIMVIMTDRYQYLHDYIASSASRSLRALLLLSVIVSEFWSLQCFKAIIPPFCISYKLTSIHVHMLNFIPAIYPLVLLFISCILMELHARSYKFVEIIWNPFRIILSKANITAVTSNALFHALASFILLSNISVLFATFQMIDLTHIYNSTGVLENKVIFIDPTVEWLSHNSLPYVFFTAVVFISISLVPSLLLCIYPTRVYRYLSQYLSARKRLAITAFAEALHSCFKDGLNGTRDYRALAGATLFVFILYCTTNNILSHITTPRTVSTIATVMWMIFVCVLSYVKPCKSAIANISLIFHMTLYGIVMTAYHLWQYESSVGTYTLEQIFIAVFVTPHVLVAVWGGYTLTKHTLTKVGHQFHGPGFKGVLMDMTNTVRMYLCCRRQGGYQEMH